MSVLEGFDFIPVDGGHPVFYRPSVRHACDSNDCRIPSRTLALEKAISDAQQILLDLVSEHSALRVEANENHDRLRRLPTEVISHIFKHCYPPPALTDDSLIHERLWDRSRPATNFPLMLVKICHHWREIAWSTQQLWSTVHVYLETSDYDRDLQINILDSWIDRSGQLPLAFTLQEVHTKENEIWEPRDPGPLLDVVRKQSHRWRSIRFYGHQNDIGRLFSTRYEPPARDLDFLAIDTRGTGTDNTPTRFLNASRLYLRDFNFLNTMSMDWKHTHFLWAGMKVENLHLLLPLVPNLRTLAIECYYLRDRFAPPPTFDFPFLESVIVTGEVKVLECIRTSSLVPPTLEIQGSDKGRDTTAPRFLSPDCPLSQITTLRILGCPIHGDMFRFVASLTKLTSLGMFCKKQKQMLGPVRTPWDKPEPEYTGVSDSFWLCLATRKYSIDRAPPQPFLPMLTDLEYNGVQSFSWPTIPKLFRLGNSALADDHASSLKSLKMKIHRDRGKDGDVLKPLDEETESRIRDLCLVPSIYVSVARIDGDVVKTLIETQTSFNESLQISS